MTKKNSGITLVALVITIIVLIILAGVSINAVMNGGLIKNAKTARNEYDEEKIKEAIRLAYLTAVAKNNGSVEEAQKLKEELSKSGLEANVSKNEDGTFIITLENGVIYRIDKNGNIIVGEAVTKKLAIENINLYNKAEMKIGRFIANNVEGANANYMVTGFIEVEPQDEIYWCAYLPEYGKFDYELTNKNYFLQSTTYLNTYDSNKEYIGMVNEAGITFDYSNNNAAKGWTVPDGVSYIRLSMLATYGRSDLADYIYVCKGEPPKYYAGYNETETTIQYNIFMPEKIQISEGTNFNIYNTNICPELYDEELTFRWECNIGTSTNNGISFNPTSKNIGTHIAKVMVYDKSNNLVATKSTSIEVSSSAISENKNILVIGDSLSNGKPWITEVESLSEGKIDLTASAVSGAMARSYYNSSTLGSGTENPFYNSETGTFDFEYYLQNNNVSYDSVILFLGTNDMGYVAGATMHIYPEINAENIKIKAIVDKIKEYNANLPIYIITPMTTVDDYFRTRTAMNFMNNFYSTFSSYNKVSIIPIELTVDQVSDFGTDKIHPLDSGYKKIADAVYSAICANQ